VAACAGYRGEGLHRGYAFVACMGLRAATIPPPSGIKTRCAAAFRLKGSYLYRHGGSTGVASSVVPTNQSDSVTTQKWCGGEGEKVKLCARLVVVSMELWNERTEKEIVQWNKAQKAGELKKARRVWELRRTDA
jgi:hypothetical protein